jgi:hypothetical protein
MSARFFVQPSDLETSLLPSCTQTQHACKRSMHANAAAFMQTQHACKRGSIHANAACMQTHVAEIMQVNGVHVVTSKMLERGPSAIVQHKLCSSEDASRLIVGYGPCGVKKASEVEFVQLFDNFVQIHSKTAYFHVNMFKFVQKNVLLKAPVQKLIKTGVAFLGHVLTNHNITL